MPRLMSVTMTGSHNGETMKKVLVIAALALSPWFAQAAGDAAAGEAKAAVCASCHGAEGKAPIMPAYPKLAGQNAEYLVLAINAYKKGERTGGMAGVMTPMVSALSDQDIADIAAYFASK